MKIIDKITGYVSSFFAGIVGLFGKKDDLSDWMRPEGVPTEVLSKRELDALENRVVHELDKNNVLQPQALFYVHKYIDAKFNKKDFDVETAYANKQSIIDQMYAEGLSEIYSSFTGYKGLVDEISVARENFERIAKRLDAENIGINAEEFDDTEEIRKEIEALPTSLAWGSKKGGE